MNWLPSTLHVPSCSFSWGRDGTRSMPFCSASLKKRSRTKRGNAHPISVVAEPVRIVGNRPPIRPRLLHLNVVERQPGLLLVKPLVMLVWHLGSARIRVHQGGSFPDVEPRRSPLSGRYHIEPRKTSHAHHWNNSRRCRASVHLGKTQNP